MGVILTPGSTITTGCTFPHTRGGDPEVEKSLTVKIDLFPTREGVILLMSQSKKPQIPFSIYVGVILTWPLAQRFCSVFRIDGLSEVDQDNTKSPQHVVILLF